MRKSECIPRVGDMEKRRCEQYSQGGAQHWLQLVIRKVGWIMQRATFVLFSSLWCPTLFISLFPWSDIVSIPIVIELKPRNIAFLWLHHTYHNILAHSQNIFHGSPHEGCHPCSEQVWVSLLSLVCNTLGVAKRIRLESSWKASSLFSWWLRHSGEAGLELSYFAWLSSELMFLSSPVARLLQLGQQQRSLEPAALLVPLGAMTASQTTCHRCFSNGMMCQWPGTYTLVKQQKQQNPQNLLAVYIL